MIRSSVTWPLLEHLKTAHLVPQVTLPTLHVLAFLTIAHVTPLEGRLWFLFLFFLHALQSLNSSLHFPFLCFLKSHQHLLNQNVLASLLFFSKKDTF